MKSSGRAWNRSSLANILAKHRSLTNDQIQANVRKRFTDFFPSAELMKKHREGLTAYVFTP